jgi:hypothetical protein
VLVNSSPAAADCKNFFRLIFVIESLKLQSALLVF